MGASNHTARPRAGRRGSRWLDRTGDRLIDETGEWEIIGRSYTSSAEKIASARVRKIGHPDVAEIRTWGAQERISVKRTASPPSAPGSTGSC
jgi:hypothetical protein